MTKISSFGEYVSDLLSPYGQIRIKAMFGGYGVYKDDIIIAIIADDELYFKVDQTNQQAYEELGSEAFTYMHRGKQFKMSYWKVPLEVLEDESLLGEWLEDSYRISLKAKRKT